MRKIQSPALEISGAELLGETATTGRGGALYTGAAAIVLLEKRWPTTAATSES